jgi:hypothetical protein
MLTSRIKGEPMTPILISDAVDRLRKGKPSISISRQRLYQLLYAGKLSYLQRKDFDGSGRARTGGRIFIDWDEISEMFTFHPKGKK